MLEIIKKIGDKWRLKLQCSKYASLFVDANNEYDAFWFDSETEAQQEWTTGLNNFVIKNEVY